MTCPKCGTPAATLDRLKVMIADDAEGPLLYYRCSCCQTIFSRLTKPAMDWPLIETDMAAWRETAGEPADATAERSD